MKIADKIAKMAIESGITLSMRIIIALDPVQFARPI